MSPVSVRPQQDHRVEAIDHGGGILDLAVGTADLCAGSPVGVDHGPVVLLSSRSTCGRDVACLTRHHLHMAFLVGQPFVGFGWVVAAAARSHRPVIFGGDGSLSRVAFRKLVDRLVQIFIQVWSAGVVEEMGRLARGVFGNLGAVVDRRVAADAVKATFGVDVPRATQVVLVGEIETRCGEALVGEDLTGGVGLPAVEQG